MTPIELVRICYERRGNPVEAGRQVAEIYGNADLTRYAEAMARAVREGTATVTDAARRTDEHQNRTGAPRPYERGKHEQED